MKGREDGKVKRRDICQEILNGIRAIKRGKGKRYEIVELAVKSIRKHVGLKGDI